MENLQYIECQNCGTIHYVISEEEAKALEKSGILFNEFSIRNLTCCSNCGLKDQFSIISESYANDYLHDNKVPPILLKNNERSKQIAATS